MGGFPTVAATKDHRLGGQSSTNVSSDSSRGRRSKGSHWARVKVPKELAPSGFRGKLLFVFSNFWGASTLVHGPPSSHQPNAPSLSDSDPPITPFKGPAMTGHLWGHLGPSPSSRTFCRVREHTGFGVGHGHLQELFHVLTQLRRYGDKTLLGSLQSSRRDGESWTRAGRGPEMETAWQHFGAQMVGLLCCRVVCGADIL